MSYTTMYAVPETGEMHEVADFKNAFRSAFLVWDELSKEHLGSGCAMRMFSEKAMKEVWDIAWDEKIPLDHRIVMAMTFDHVMVRRENFSRLIDAINQYSKRFDTGTLGKQADKLRELADDESVYAVCWNQTSVSMPVWQIQDGEDDFRLYDLSRDSGHWFLFDRIIHEKGE